MKILVPVDGSEPALDAVRHALRLRRAGLQASFVLATVQEPTFLYEMILAPDAEVLERVTGAVGSRAHWKVRNRCSRRPAFPSSARLARATRRPR
jgi:nucleotide-binding universal stress UspA family protein